MLTHAYTEGTQAAKEQAEHAYTASRDQEGPFPLQRVLEGCGKQGLALTLTLGRVRESRSLTPPGSLRYPRFVTILP